MNPVAGLALATIAFVGSHFAMSHPLRLRLIQNLGEAGFVLFYSVVSVATLGWIYFAWPNDGSSVAVWIAPDWWWPIASALMLLASILLVGAFVKNPAFPHPGAELRKVRPATGVFAITRHPMNMAFALWALVHISISWSAPNLIVAVGILILAVGGSIGQDRKKSAAIGDVWRRWEGATSLVPFGALFGGRARWRDAAPGWLAAIGGFLLWLVVTTFHVPGVSPIVWLGMRYL